MFDGMVLLLCCIFSFPPLRVYATGIPSILLCDKQGVGHVRGLGAAPQARTAIVVVGIELTPYECHTSSLEANKVAT